MQAAAALGEDAGVPRLRNPLARIGDCADHGPPGLQQAEPDRTCTQRQAPVGQCVPQRVGEQFRHHDRHVVAKFRSAPSLQGGDGEVTAGAHRTDAAARGTRGDTGEAGPVQRAGPRRQRPVSGVDRRHPQHGREPAQRCIRGCAGTCAEGHIARQEGWVCGHDRPFSRGEGGRDQSGQLHLLLCTYLLQHPSAQTQRTTPMHRPFAQILCTVHVTW